MTIRNSAKAIVIGDNCLLAIRNLDAQGDWYILPGGGQEHGETLPQALQRECLEELGTIVQVGTLKLVREYIAQNHEFANQDSQVHQMEFMFACEVPAGYTPQSGPARDSYQTGVDWLPLPDLMAYRLYPQTLRPILMAGMPKGPIAYLGDVN